MGRVRIIAPAASAPEELFEALEITGVSFDEAAGKTYLHLAEPLDITAGASVLFRLWRVFIDGNRLRYIVLYNGASNGKMARTTFSGFEYYVRNSALNGNGMTAEYNAAQCRIEVAGLVRAGTEPWRLERFCT